MTFWPGRKADPQPATAEPTGAAEPAQTAGLSQTAEHPATARVTEMAQLTETAQLTGTAEPDGAVEPSEPAEPIGPARAPFPSPSVFGDPTLGSDPRGIPSVADAVPDTVLDGAHVGGLTIRGASLRGDGHRFQHEPRQDSMGLWALPGTDPEAPEAILICVADGVSSEPESHLGARSACRNVRDEVVHSYPALLDPASDGRLAELCNGLVGRVARRMTEEAERSGRDPRSRSTTLVAALVDARPADPGRRRCVLFAVGDSPAYVLRDGVFERCFPDPHDGLISDTGTRALPASYQTASAAVARIGPDDMLLLCTDGLADPMRTAPVEKTLARWWGAGETPSLPEFCWQLGFRAKSYADDRTAVCVWGR